MKKIILSMLTLSTIAFSSCGEKESDDPKAKTEKDSKDPKAEAETKVSATYHIDEASLVTWNVRHYKDTEHAHTGTVAINTGSIVVEDGSVIGGQFEFNMTQIIEPGTDTTQSHTLQGHLTMPDYFNTAAFTTSTFAISSFTDGMVTGDLEVIGVSKEITFPAEVIVSAEAVTVSAEFELSMLQFELPSLVEGDALPEDEKMESPNPVVTFQLDVSASKAAH